MSKQVAILLRSRCHAALREQWGPSARERVHAAIQGWVTRQTLREVVAWGQQHLAALEALYYERASCGEGGFVLHHAELRGVVGDVYEGNREIIEALGGEEGVLDAQVNDTPSPARPPCG